MRTKTMKDRIPTTLRKHQDFRLLPASVLLPSPYGLGTALPVLAGTRHILAYYFGIVLW